VVLNATAAIPQIQSYLASHNITVRSIEKIRPTLEDVFVSLTSVRSPAAEAKP
jgi:ABC-type multidrug transport system ATPase subunit